MFEHIRGRLEDAALECAVVECHGVGYEIIIPRSTLEGLPSLGEEVKLFTHFHVREDTQKLYGFLTKGERSVFRLLIGISKVGPKVAINVLSGLSVGELVQSVRMSDASRLSSVSGIGPKTAQRLVMELRGKLDGLGETESMPMSQSGVAGPPLVRNEAHVALVSLGYGESQVRGALARVEQAVEGDMPVEEWIRKALQVI